MEMLRQQATSIVEAQSPGIAQLQRATPGWVREAAERMAVLGTHEFFLAALPLFFFVDEPSEVGLSIVSVLALGVCGAASVKDAVCAPRPFGVTRKKSSTAQEFGLPSTHSCNAASVGVVLCVHFSEPLWLLYPLTMGLSRVVTGMHSWLDVGAGWLLGAAIAAAWVAVLPATLTLLASNDTLSILSLTAIVPLYLAMHPDPVAPCPCFDDAVAFVAVLAGVLVAFHWRTSVTTASDVVFELPLDQQAVWWSVANTIAMIRRITVGAFAIYVFRKVTKTFLLYSLNTLFPSFSELAIIKKQKLLANVSGNGMVNANGKGSSKVDSINANITCNQYEKRDANSLAPQNPPTFKIFRLTNKKVVDVIVYFGIAVIAVDSVPRLFYLLGI
ncbi:UNVERIFIED_CONTAM: hypothetical protein HDU68_008577 [Siphonaria sp. JEL0065]|nr:hypothetical protein HDU68_008577 [Siphonaria sp. JEL0065]